MQVFSMWDLFALCLLITQYVVVKKIPFNRISTLQYTSKCRDILSNKYVGRKALIESILFV